MTETPAKTVKHEARTGCDKVVPWCFWLADNAAQGRAMPKLDQHLRIKGAADYPGVTRSTLRNWEAAGRIPVY